MLKEAVDIVQALRQHINYNERPHPLTIGELSEYDPSRHYAKFTLPLIRDAGGNEAETGFLPLGSIATGNGWGFQGPPEQGHQAVIAFLDAAGLVPVVLCFLPNEIEVPPFPDGKSFGWQDKHGGYSVTTEDGETPGDGAKGYKVGGVGYVELLSDGKLALGAEGLSADYGVGRKKDLQLIVTAINALIDALNTHKHLGVTAGGALSGVPQTALTHLDPAQASVEVTAKD